MGKKIIQASVLFDVSEFVQLIENKGFFRGPSFCLAHGIMEWWNIEILVLIRKLFIH